MLKNQDVETQARQIAENLRREGIKDAQWDTEIVALIAYLQRLGTDIKGDPSSTADQFK
jgi:cytochrome c oxidase cbb3-type subunit I/II